MVRAYLNVRATGGAVEPLPWRGLRGWGEGRSPLGRGLGDRKKAKRSWLIEKYHFMILHTLLTLAYYLSDKHHVCLVYAAYILVYAMPLVISIHKSLKLQTTVCF